MVRIDDLTISSPDFAQGGALDPRFSKDGGNQAPRLEIAGVPDDATELAIICHDPDAPMPRGFTHWVLTNLPATTTTIDAAAIETATEGPNDFGGTGWGGPQPPPGHGTHHYCFWVYAMGTQVAGPISREDFLDRYADQILEQNRTVGTFENG